jgi:hypothetical protein
MLQRARPHRFGRVGPACTLVAVTAAVAGATIPSVAEPVGGPVRCGTPVVREELNRTATPLSSLPDRVAKRLGEPPARQPLARAATSPSGRFRLSYVLQGPHAVPDVDSDPANGVPDLVDHAALALDGAWEILCGTLGFADPVPSDGPYEVTFRAIDVFGYVLPLDDASGGSRMVLANSFAGAPPNDDPDGDVRGLLRATCAHELKHASQYRGSRWREDGWIELDAVWAEEAVFPAVNDYLYYLMHGCPVREPEVPLDAGPTGTGSYEDCVWQLWLASACGPEAVVDVWSRRAARTGEGMLTTYAGVLERHGLDMAEAWRRFTAWNYAVGERTLPGSCYADAAAYVAAPPTAVLPVDGPAVNGAVPRLAAHFVQCALPEDATGWIRLDARGATDPALVLSAVITCADGRGEILPLLRGPDGTASLVLPAPLESLADLAVVVANATAGEAAPLAYELRAVTEVRPPRPDLRLPEPEVTVTLAPGGRASRSVPLHNAGARGSTVVFSVDPARGVADPLPAAWVQVRPRQGTIPGGETKLIELEIDGAALTPGRHEAVLPIRHSADGEPLELRVVASVRADQVLASGPWPFGLVGAVPNPCNPATEIRFSLDASARVVVEIVDLQGRRVRGFPAAQLEAGDHAIAWDGRTDAGRPAASGLYVVRLRADGRAASVKIVLTR